MAEQDSFDAGVIAGKALMLKRMEAMATLMVEAGHATPYLKHFVRQIAEEERIEVTREQP